MKNPKTLIDSAYRKKNGNLAIIIKQLPIENLVFEGGEPKGLVYIGAVEVLEKNGVLENIKNVGGSSAGAMTALALGLGYKAHEIKEIVSNVELGDFMDIRDPDSPSVIRTVKKRLSNLLFGDEHKGTGLFLGDKLQQWSRDVIAKRLEAANSRGWNEVADKLKNERDYKFTFRQLKEFGDAFPELGIKTICFTGTNYTDQKLEFFDYHKTPDLPIDLAVRISMSLPWFFKSVKYNGKVYMDGGCLNNYPMVIFDEHPYFQPGRNKFLTGNQGVWNQNICTLGLKVDSQDEIRKILWEGAKQTQESWISKLGSYLANQLKDLLSGVQNTDAEKLLNQDIYEKYPQRTIQIPDLGYSTFKFNLTNEDKEKLADSGRHATAEWLNNYYQKDTAVEIEVTPQELGTFGKINNLSPEEIARLASIKRP
jgi:NTE family protein